MVLLPSPCSRRMPSPSFQLHWNELCGTQNPPQLRTYMYQGRLLRATLRRVGCWLMWPATWMKSHGSDFLGRVSCYVLEALIFIFHLLTNTFLSHDLFPPPFHHMTCSHPFSITWLYHLTDHSYHVILFGCACDSYWLQPSSTYSRTHVWVSSTWNDSILCMMTPY